MNPNVKLGLALGAGALGLVLLHAFAHGQSAASSATSMGATLSAPFAVQPTGGDLTNGVQIGAANNATATGGNATTDASVTAASSTANGGATVASSIAPNYGIPEQGWSQALGGMQSLSEGTPPWEIYGAAANG